MRITINLAGATHWHAKWRAGGVGRGAGPPAMQVWGVVIWAAYIFMSL